MAGAILCFHRHFKTGNVYCRCICLHMVKLDATFPCPDGIDKYFSIYWPNLPLPYHETPRWKALLLFFSQLPEIHTILILLIDSHMIYLPSIHNDPSWHGSHMLCPGGWQCPPGTAGRVMPLSSTCRRQDTINMLQDFVEPTFASKYPGHPAFPTRLYLEFLSSINSLFGLWYLNCELMTYLEIIAWTYQETPTLKYLEAIAPVADLRAEGGGD